MMYLFKTYRVCTFALLLTSFYAVAAVSSVIVVGAQFGDEGKGKIIDLLSERADIVVRAQGGNNAGHTVIVGGTEYKFHLLPSGILRDTCQCYLAGGMVIDPQVLLKEIEQLKKMGIQPEGRLWISPSAHVIMSYHKILDTLAEKAKGGAAIGTTGRGIGPCYADKTNRLGIRMIDFINPHTFQKMLEQNLGLVNNQLRQLYNVAEVNLVELYDQYFSYAQQLAPYVKHDLELQLADEVKAGKYILFEGAQGTFLDVTFGTVPYVTSSSTLAAGICMGAGVGPSCIDHTLAVVKSYTTRVGNGPLPTEIAEKEVFLDWKDGREFGTTTGRKRRIGWFDAVLARTAMKLNGVDSIALTKLDVLDTVKRIKICTGYLCSGITYTQLPTHENLAQAVPIYEEMDGWLTPTSALRTYQELPENAKRYIQRIEQLCGTPISIVSVGPEREQTIMVNGSFFS